MEKGNAQEGFVYINRLISTKEKANKVKVIEEIKLSKPITYKAGATSDKN